MISVAPANGGALLNLADMSIYDSAAIIAWKVPNTANLPAHRYIHKLILAIQGDPTTPKVTYPDHTDHNLFDDIICVDLANSSGDVRALKAVKIFIDPKHYDRDPYLFLHLSLLMELFELRGVETSLSSAEKERGAMAEYKIEPLCNDKYLEEPDHRLAILIVLTSIRGVAHPTHTKAPPLQTATDGSNSGIVEFQSPSDALEMLGDYETKFLNGYNYKIHITPLKHFLRPMSFTHLVAFVTDGESSFSSLGFNGYALKRILKFINTSTYLHQPNLFAAIETLYHSNDETQLHCSVNNMEGANALCNHPLPNGQFFRPVFIVNQDPAFCLKDGICCYYHVKREEYSQMRRSLKPDKNGKIPLPPAAFVYTYSTPMCLHPKKHSRTQTEAVPDPVFHHTSQTKLESLEMRLCKALRDKGVQPRISGSSERADVVVIDRRISRLKMEISRQKRRAKIAGSSNRDFTPAHQHAGIPPIGKQDSTDSVQVGAAFAKYIQRKLSNGYQQGQESGSAASAPKEDSPMSTMQSVSDTRMETSKDERGSKRLKVTRLAPTKGSEC